LLSFLPHDLADQLLRNPHGDALRRAWQFDAVALVADISGFTAISEALGGTGTRGVEELTEILNGFFGPTIELIESFGGIVAKFGGDAVTVLFRASKRGNGATRRAVRCALELQAQVTNAGPVGTSAGDYRLSLRVGLARGRVVSVSVGDPGLRLEHVVAGGVLDRAAAAQKSAKPGEVLLDRTLASEEVPGTVAIGRSGTFARAPAPAPQVRHAPLRRRAGASAAAVEAAAPYLHPSLVERLRAGRRDFVNEHRRVTILFGKFEDFDYDTDPRAPVRLQRYAGDLVRIVDRYGGFLRQIHMGDKGSTYIVLFGAPIAHEDDERRALRCALELLGLSEASSALGVNTGEVFCGFVGSASRQEYAVIGDAVNVAARLMGEAALGDIIVSEETVRGAAAGFAVEPLAPLSLKGKSEPVPVSRLLGQRERVPDRRPKSVIVGRAAEVREVEGHLDRALGGTGVLLGITGDPGIGKSLLADTASQLAARRGFDTYRGECEPFGTHIPYLPWRQIWRELLRVPDASPERQIADLGGLLAELAPELENRVPLLGPLLGLTIPETGVTRALDPELRRESLHGLLITCLRAHVERVPGLLLVLEDCHWLDESSRELLEVVARAVSDLPAVVICTYRRGIEHAEVHARAGLAGLPQAELVLSALRDDDIEKVVRARLAPRRKQASVADATLRAIATRAGGNPFFAAELANYVGAGRSEEDLPDTLRSLVLARIDQLRDSEKTTLSVASVIGNRFPASWVSGSYSAAVSRDQVEAHLEALCRAELTTLETMEPEPEYAFRHSTTREVAYDTLAFSTREALHQNVGEFIERNLADGDDAGHLDLLAYHFGHSASRTKQRIYFRRAGDAAQAAYANESAIDYYERLIPLLDGAARSGAMCDLAAALQVVGRWDEAAHVYRDALSLADEVGAELEAARSRAGLGNLKAHVGAHGDAVVWLTRAQSAFQRLGNREELRRTLEHLSYAYFWRSDYKRAERSSLEALEVARSLGDDTGQSSAYECLGLVHWHLGEHERAKDYFLEAVSTAEASGYRPGVMAATNDLAGLLVEQGEYHAAFDYLRKAFETAIEVGARRNVGAAVSNAGLLNLERGDYVAAEACFLYGLRQAAQIGRWTGILNAVGNLGVICFELGQLSDAERLLNRAIQISAATDDSWNKCFFVQKRAEVLAAAGRPQEAQTEVAEALAVAGEVNFRQVEFDARLLDARLRARRAPTQVARELEALAAEFSASRELADALYELWRLDPDRHDVRERAASLYEELHASTPNVRFRRRFERLTGTKLREPPPLPPLSADIPAAPSLAVVAREAERLSAAAPGAA
jgi:class 3 adenylate cyclase/tetratricopeptide (TPR) repeat protein